MLDYINLPDTTNGTVDYFIGSSETNSKSWVLWEKPTGCHLIKIICIGGGGGGSSGYSSNTTGSRGGGGGGGSGGASTVLIPSYFLPEKLYISSGLGGRGGDPNPNPVSAGSAGVASYICVHPSISAFYRVCFANGGGAGGIPSTTAGGLAGAAATIATIADMPLAANGTYSFTGGSAGGAGSFAASGSSSTYPLTGAFFSGGGGGSGGVTTSSSTASTFAQGIFNFLPATSSGQNGMEVYKLLLSIGGGGGGANSGTGNGVSGGDGGFGSGGGGGGAGGANAAGGGGKGGNGLVIIQTW